MPTTITVEARMNAILEFVCHLGAPRLVEFEDDRDATVGNGYETDDSLAPTQNGASDTEHYGASDDEYN